MANVVIIIGSNKLTIFFLIPSHAREEGSDLFEAKILRRLLNPGMKGGADFENLKEHRKKMQQPNALPHYGKEFFFFLMSTVPV